MQTLVWLAIPVVTTVIAVAWVAWAGRPRKPEATYESLARHERFRQAASRPAPSARSKG